MPHDIDGRHLVRRRGDAGAEPGRGGGCELRRRENDRRAGECHQYEFAHGLHLGCTPSADKEALLGLNSS
jgi:hypothetical protein